MRIMPLTTAAALRGAAPLVSTQGILAARALYEGEEKRPGRSDLAYMQHRYTPLDSRIIIITAAILLLLLAILLLNFFIRWALRRIFLLRAEKPINLNKGLSKRQLQALPSFVFSSSKLLPPSCAHPTFYPPFFPFTSHFDPIKAPSPKVDPIDFPPPAKFTVSVPVLTDPPQFVSTQSVDVDTDPSSKFGSSSIDRVIMTSDDNPPKEDEPLNNLNPIITSTATSVDCNVTSTTPNVHTIYNEVKDNSLTLNDDNPMIDCTKAKEMANHVEHNACSTTPCPICLVDFADGDTIRVLPGCQHYFHIECIDMWLAKSSSCPACRANLLEATKTRPTLQIQVVTTHSL